MNKRSRKVFETDRRMELRLRLASKKAKTHTGSVLVPQYAGRIPEREIVTRIIERVLKL